MKSVDTVIQKLDRFQRRHRLLAFAYAVIQKYNDDEAGYRAALLTYYAFLALFPLLLVLTTLTTMIAGSHSELQNTVIKSTTNYFPVLGSQLAAHISSLHKNGFALFIGILFTLYGTRGVADAFRHGVQHIWGIPKAQRDGFPESLFKSLGLIIIGGGGFIAASILASLTAGAGRGAGFRLLSLVVHFAILFLLFIFLLNVSLPKHITVKETRAGAVSAALGLVILQTLGGLLVSHQFKRLDALYSIFALSLGLLFWIYLQSQVLFYSAEIAVVSAQKRWPRSLSGHDLTAADRQAKAYLEQQV